MKKNFFCLIFILFLFISPKIVLAKGDIFYIDSSYDLFSREKIEASLHQISEKALFYVEDDYYSSLSPNEKKELEESLKKLGEEFSKVIYPILTSNFGSEWTPGIDGEKRIIILVHQMKEGTGGYFREEDEYPKIQAPFSNEKEMLYLNPKYLTYPLLSKSFLAHEFVHLITFNQKNRLRKVSEERWLNELRAEYAPTLLGYDKTESEETNLKIRINHFLENPSDSLINWEDEKADYGVINLFGQYLVDHYGFKILRDSLRSSEVGISSINYALKKNGFDINFSQVFTDWIITLLINNCQIGEKYCYKNELLKEIRISPFLNFLPLSGESTLTYGNSTQIFTGNWFKIIGGRGTLKLRFDGAEDAEFEVFFILEKTNEGYEIRSLELDEKQDGEILIPNFGKEISSLILIPLALPRDTLSYSEFTSYYSFFWSASLIKNQSQNEELINQLLKEIERLKREIEEVQKKIYEILSNKFYCKSISMDLRYGMKNDQVKCLQQFLKAQGKDIYPEGLVTGYFGPLTRSAVIRFQEKYAKEILEPLGLKKGTGFVGPKTRAKINEILKNLTNKI